MTLSEIQPFAAEKLQAATSLQPAVVILDDGTYPATPNREAALTGRGIALIVWDPQPSGEGDQIPDGSGGFYSVTLNVVVEENPKRARLPVESGGCAMSGVKAVERVIATLAGSAAGANVNFGLRPMTPPFVDFGMEEGIRKWVVQFAVLVPIE